MLPRCSKYFSCGGDRNPSLLGCSALPGRYKDQVIKVPSGLKVLFLDVSSYVNLQIALIVSHLMVNQYLLLMRYEGLSSFYYFTVPFETQRMGLAQTPTEENCEPTTRQIDLAIGSPSQYISRYHSPIEGP